MSDTLSGRRTGAAKHAALDVEAVRAAYRRWAGIYDTVFGGILLGARRRAVAMVNQLPGREVLEVGVGTGLALPYYAADKRIIGIDLSAEMLALAGKRVADLRLRNIAALREMDAEFDRFPRRLVRCRRRDVRRLGGAASTAIAGRDAARGAAWRQHPVRHTYCC